jgi:histidinol-phosphate aminotransferase
VSDAGGWRRHLRPGLAALSVYHAPRQRARARMHANENPEPWPAEVMSELAELVRTIELGRYPDSSGSELRELLATRHHCEPGRIVLGNGSDEVISLLLTALGGGEQPVLVVPTPSFVMYGHSARVLGYTVREVELDDALELREPELDEALHGATICFFARPNNPTGSLWSAAAIMRLVAAHPAVVFVIDEAYVAYAPGASLWRPDHPENVVHMGTLSKVGLAALRVGYGIANPELALALDKVRHPYNVSQTSLTIAHAVLDRFADVQAELVARAIASRERLATLLARLPGAQVFPSAANLVLVRLPTPERAAALVQLLAREGILVKDVGHLPRLRACVRASVGTAAELDLLEQAIAPLTADRVV